MAAPSTPVAAPPAELAAAISAASKQYGVPADLLAGIWRVESGGHYPNPYVNSSGYGGLFGTRNWNASVTAQANTAASVLQAGLVKSGGNIGEALSYYNSGKLSGGYTSVPGETTFGTWNPAQAKLQAGSPGTISDVTGAVTGAAGDVKSAITAVPDALKFLFSYRFLEILGGGLLILAGLYVLAKQFQQSFPDPLGLGARAVAGEQQERVVVREQRAAETHTARVAQTRARTTEIRSRSRARTTTARLSKEAARREYNRGALDQATAEASPTMTKIRRQRG